MDEKTLQLLTLCALRIDGKSLDWNLIARTARAGRLDDLWEGMAPATEAPATRSAASAILHAATPEIREDARARAMHELDVGRQSGARLVTVLDESYPLNLRLVPDLPPFLFISGQVLPEDSRAVAVVGTRQASDHGLLRAARLARELSENGVAVTSGLARGIDTAAHTAALEAGGRTLAIIGTGVTRCYPPENAALARRIIENGAVVSQFWPTRAPGRDTFPRRNRVTSGISQGTVVIEASSTSGAKMQARLAYEHGKRVWLLASLVTRQPWAQTMVELGRAKVIHTTEDVLRDLDTQGEPETTAITDAAVQDTLEFA